MKTHRIGASASHGRFSTWTRKPAKFLVLLPLLALPLGVEAQFNYITNELGTIIITAYTGPGGDVVIPGTTNGLPVTIIGNTAFVGCGSLVSLTIPNSVTKIGDGAFLNCPSLSAITVDGLNPVYTSMDGALFDKSQTVLIQYPGGKAGAYTVPSSVTEISAFAFELCANLTSVTIGESVATIRDEAFANCWNLTSVTIPKSVTKIGDRAFMGCVGITNVTIDNSSINFGFMAFYGCTSLISIVIPGSYTSTLSLTHDVITIIKYTGSGSAIDIPITINGLPVTGIGNSAFGNCTNLTRVTIPNSVTNIGDSAFAHCLNLTNVIIPNSISSIEGSTFQDCWRLTGIYFNGNSPSVANEVFSGDSDATVYYLPGTTGWGPTFGGRPTAQWLLPYPQILKSPNLGVQTNGFGFILSWATNASVVVDASADLTNPGWVPLSTNVLTDGSSYFSDPQWTNYPSRFYRLRSP